MGGSEGSRISLGGCSSEKIGLGGCGFPLGGLSPLIIFVRECLGLWGLGNSGGGEK